MANVYIDESDLEELLLWPCKNKKPYEWGHQCADCIRGKVLSTIGEHLAELIAKKISRNKP